jgi:hypothetical protein
MARYDPAVVSVGRRGLTKNDITVLRDRFVS